MLGSVKSMMFVASSAAWPRNRCVRSQCSMLRLLMPGTELTKRSVAEPTFYLQYRKVVRGSHGPRHVNGVLVGSIHDLLTFVYRV